MRRHLTTARAVRYFLLLASGFLLVTASAAPAMTSRTDAADPPRPTTSQAGTVGIADFGSYGPYRVGMTVDQVRAAANGRLAENTGLLHCTEFVDTTATSDAAYTLSILLTERAGNRVVGIRLPIYAKTSKGIGFGSSKKEAEHAYAAHIVSESPAQVGTVVLVQGDDPNQFLGFMIGFNDDTVVGVLVGDHDFAAGYELCSDG